MDERLGPDEGWVIDLDRNAQVLVWSRPGVALLLCHTPVVAGWVRALCLSQGRLGASFVRPAGRDWDARVRHGSKRFELTPGLYEVQSTDMVGLPQRCFVVVAQGQPLLTEDRESALREAALSGVLVLPAPDELWGWVRSLCAQGLWHEVRRDLWPLVQDAALAEQIEAYCAAAQAHTRARVCRDVVLPPLKGTPKQLPWAEDLRARRVSELLDAEEALDSLGTAWPELYAAVDRVVVEVGRERAHLEREARASYWIALRDAPGRLVAVTQLIRVCLRRGAPDLTKEEQLVIRDNEELVREHLAATEQSPSPPPQERKSDGE